MIKQRYVTDTNGLISFYSEVFDGVPRFNPPPKISKRAEIIIKNAVCPYEGSVLLSVPSIVFIEIYKKWFHSEEFSRKFFYEVFSLLKQSPNVEIRAIDQELLENLLTVKGSLSNHDLHDKIIVASAITLECPIITVDSKIIEFVEKEQGRIPKVIN